MSVSAYVSAASTSSSSARRRSRPASPPARRRSCRTGTRRPRVPPRGSGSPGRRPRARAHRAGRAPSRRSRSGVPRGTRCPWPRAAGSSRPRAVPTSRPATSRSSRVGGRVVHRGERDDLPPGRALGHSSAGAVSVHDRFLRSRAPTGCLADRGTTPAVGTVSIREESAASGDALRASSCVGRTRRRTPGGRGQLARSPAAAIWRRPRHPLPLSEPKTAGCRAAVCSSPVDPTEVLRKQVPAQV